MPTTISITRKGHAAVGRRERRIALRESMLFIGRLHHRRYKMLKFRDSAVRRYNLTPRGGEPGSGQSYKGSYTEAKVTRGLNGQGVRAIGESKPFVWGGATRQNAKASRKVEAKAQNANRGTCSVIIPAPALNLKSKGGRVNTLEEFKRIAEVERKNQEVAGLKRYDRSLSKTKPKTTIIRG